MKSLVFLDSQEELEVLKDRVKSGEQVYTIINGKTHFLEMEGEVIMKRPVGVRELNRFFRLFPPSEIEEESDTENETDLQEENTPVPEAVCDIPRCEAVSATTDGRIAEFDKRLYRLECRCVRIEQALCQPILQPAIEAEKGGI